MVFLHRFGYEMHEDYACKAIEPVKNPFFCNVFAAVVAFRRSLLLWSILKISSIFVIQTTGR